MVQPPAARSPAARSEVVDWCELTLTQRCNQRCFFCYEDGRDVARDPDVGTIDRLLRETGARAEQVVLCGKEVLLRPDVLDIVARAAAHGLRVVVFTNGQALAREGLVEALADAGCASVTVSFHFPDPETFARGTRTSARGFERTLRGLAAVARHNAARPRRAIGLSTETAMSALNAGRLAGMRGALREALAGAAWKMRLSTLLPTRTHDIGLPHVLEPLADRRDELARFVATHPPEIPLHFVKVPLCMIPPGHEHRSLEVEYFRAGTALTFNHGDPDRITTDEITPSGTRDVAASMAAHPYRWVCRSCLLAPLCRFERVDWHHARFEPARSQKPEPRQAPTALEVLARLGPTPGAEARLAAAQGALRRPFPEEEVLAALASDGAGPALVDAWTDREPILTVRLAHGDDAVTLRLAPPRRAHARRPLGAIVGYLEARAAGGGAQPPEAVRACLAALARVRLPEIERWAGAPGFDPDVARRFRAAWERFGERLWPGLGVLGGWRTRAVSLASSGAILLELAGPGRGRIAVEHVLEGAGERIACILDARGDRALPEGAYAAATDELRALAGDVPLRVHVARGPLPPPA